jgi:hypothetical protein
VIGGFVNLIRGVMSNCQVPIDFLDEPEATGRHLDALEMELLE